MGDDLPRRIGSDGEWLLWAYRPPGWPREILWRSRTTPRGHCVEDRGMWYYVIPTLRRPCRCHRAVVGLECPHQLLAELDRETRQT